MSRPKDYGTGMTTSFDEIDRHDHKYMYNFERGPFYGLVTPYCACRDGSVWIRFLIERGVWFYLDVPYGLELRRHHKFPWLSFRVMRAKGV